MEQLQSLHNRSFGAKDGEAWKKYATEVIGMELLDDGEGDRFYLRMDDWHHRIAVHTSGEEDRLYFGWRVDDCRRASASRAARAARNG